MFSIIVAVGPTSDKISLLYKDKERAHAALAIVRAAGSSGIVMVSDEFGQTIWIPPDQIHAVIFEDMELSGQASIERGLHQARVNAKGNSQAQNDSTLRTAAMMGGGPSILHPGSRG